MILYYLSGHQTLGWDVKYEEDIKYDGMEDTCLEYHMYSFLLTCR